MDEKLRNAFWEVTLRFKSLVRTIEYRIPEVGEEVIVKRGGVDFYTGIVVSSSKESENGEGGKIVVVSDEDKKTYMYKFTEESTRWEDGGANIVIAVYLGEKEMINRYKFSLVYPPTEKAKKAERINA